MARPTEPGWYWLNRFYSGWEIVQVGEDGWYGMIGREEAYRVADTEPDQWDRITQEPPPPPPF